MSDDKQSPSIVVSPVSRSTNANSDLHQRLLTQFNTLKSQQFKPSRPFIQPAAIPSSSALEWSNAAFNSLKQNQNTETLQRQKAHQLIAHVQKIRDAQQKVLLMELSNFPENSFVTSSKEQSSQSAPDNYSRIWNNFKTTDQSITEQLEAIDSLCEQCEAIYKIVSQSSNSSTSQNASANSSSQTQNRSVDDRKTNRSTDERNLNKR